MTKLNILAWNADGYTRVREDMRVMGPLTENESRTLTATYGAHASWMATNPDACEPLAVDLMDWRYYAVKVRAGEECSCLMTPFDCQDCIDGGGGLSQAW